MKILTFLIIFFFPLNSFAIDKKVPLQNLAVAKINNKIITSSALNDRYRFVINIAKIKVNSPQEEKILISQILDKMIDEDLIRQEASSLKIEATADEIKESVDNVAMQQKKNATQFKLSFIKNNLSFDSYLQQTESEILWSKIVLETLRSKVKVTDVEVREFFEQQKFNTNVRKILIAEIFIPQSENASQLATKLVVELKQGANFKNIVEQFSRSTTGDNGGEIGWVSQGDVDPAVYSAILKVTKGGYSDPVLVSDGYHIFKVLDIKTETKVADHDLNAAHNIIFSKKLQTLAKGYLSDLRKKSFVEVSL